jgi:glycosyltransferase involved in cell wall biosynthesis
MKLILISHKPCWQHASSATGFATNGGFPFQVQALSQLFDETKLLLPFEADPSRAGEIPLGGHRLSVVPLASLPGKNIIRKLRVPLWLLRNLPAFLREVWAADAIHAPIPGDVGSIGILLALALHKPLFVRHCGNWLAPKTIAEKVWRWGMETFAGGRNVMLATGGALDSPSLRNPAVKWIFSTSLAEAELAACAVKRAAPPRDQVRLIIVCRQEKAKGTWMVLAALPLLRRDFPGLAIDVVGDGSALPELREQVAKLRLADQVRFHGNVDHGEVLRLLKQAHLFCFPTRSSDGFPKAVLEGLACGLPAVTTRVSVLPLLLSSGCGRLVEEATPEAIAVAIRYCLEDPARYEQLSIRAVETARQYSLEHWRDTIGAHLSAAWGPLRVSDTSPVVSSPVVSGPVVRASQPRSPVVIPSPVGWERDQG